MGADFSVIVFPSMGKLTIAAIVYIFNSVIGS